ncbi:uncharacterized protein LOC109812964 [Cajanus cajan]|uniref:uncharacterized protein LOC109812964 n=1 Tax=Cajanus cajan TaxID=3821 RepID=UPI00098D9057|nr:uncharacterized protein LOC109812964 [Cajanus cajan]
MMKLFTKYVNSVEKRKEDPPCKHFSIRGYVAGQRQKDWKMCSPFKVNESMTQSPLPPLFVPKFRSWSCNTCRRENGFNVEAVNTEEFDKATSAQVMELGECNNNLSIDDEEFGQASLMEIAETMITSLPNVKNVNCGLLNSSQYDKSTKVIEVLNKPVKEKDFDLNIPYSIDIYQEMVDGNIGLETSGTTNEEYLFSSQHNVEEPHPNQRSCFDLNSIDITPSMDLFIKDSTGKKSTTYLNPGGSDQMPKKILNTGDYLNTNLDIDSSKKTFYPSEVNAKLDIGKSMTYDSLEGQQSDSHKKSNLSDKSHGLTIFGRKLTGPSNLVDQNVIVSGQEQVNNSSSFMQNRNNLFDWLDLEEEEEETPPLYRGSREIPILLNDTSERSCGMNKNPSELCPIQPGNPYLMDKEDKTEKRVCKKRHGSSSKQKKKSKKR